jgi:Cu(I)/Ag(I) efflux system membrane fusion protein
MKMNKFFSNKYFRYGSLVISGIFMGWLFFHSPQKTTVQNVNTAEKKQETIWTCAMHPQIRMHEPGKCPICGMDLIPLNQSNAEIDPAAVHLTEDAAQLANVLTSVVTRQKPLKEVRLYGKVQTDERLLQSQVAHISGRIEKLLVNFTGEVVQKGQTLAVIYSPEIVTAQQELLEASKTKQSQPQIYEAAKERLRQWRLSESQINSIENSGNIQNNVEIVSDISGIITSRRVNNGDYVNQGTILFDVADLSRVWVLFDAYESDLQFLQKGDHLEFTVQALPGIKFSGNIAFIDPVIDPVNRVAKVRIEAENQSGRLKPEMFVTGIVHARLDEYRNMLVIPKSAVLWTGTRSIVYIKQANTDEPVFKMREIGLGPMLGNSYVITDGLMEGEEIVTQGAFSVDAAAQLEGKPSMMNPQGGKTSSMPGMIMPGDSKSDDKQNTPGMDIPSDKKDNGNAKNENSSQNTAGKVTKIDVSMDFVMKLNTVFDQYITLKDAFVQGDAKKVKQVVMDVQQSLANVDMKLLTGDANKKWMDISGKLDNFIIQISSSSDIEVQRKAFSDFSNEFYKAIKTFGLMGKTAYYQFCPMAFNEKGAFWLSTIKEIRNPYFGDKMPTCGETKETLKY